MDLYDQLPNSRLICLPEYAPVLESAKQSGVTVVEFLTLNPDELTKLVMRSITDIVKFQSALKEEFRTQVFELNQPRQVSQRDYPLTFTSGDKDIDDLLGGGLRTHGITEVFGSSSTGKSQFLMQLSLCVQLPKSLGGLDGKCVYITTEGDLPTRRLDEMIRSKSQKHGFKSLSQNNIFTVNCNDLANQEHILNVQLPILMERNRDIKLIIVDSVSHHVRVELERRSFKDSQDNRHYVDKMAQNLLDFSIKYSVAVVVANQVGDKPLPEAKLGDSSLGREPANYDYQLGWTVGWKDSSILYRQLNGGLTLSGKDRGRLCSDLGNESVLSDDEDYNFIASAAQARTKELDTRKLTGKSLTASSDQTALTPRSQSFSSGSPGTYFPIIKKKRNVETKYPTMGLTWANHLSTRILLRKSYKASPLIKSGELDLNKILDTSSFWQPRRTMKVVFSFYAPCHELEYLITSGGVESVKSLSSQAS
ncbi:LAQU0S06e02630g1_1 [Lachancea quebecensis]|uniref:LAQU0S06e02630g1_1 n=1 Tax=Lachancea quebecensis TaxID=1654605 RepID=A0A0P1KRW0_9SACH|nr:LAQU0S06e02630g1_1 [Lachancea quebecensis]